MEAKCPSETSVDFQRTTRRYNTEDRNLHNGGCDDLKAYITSETIPSSLFSNSPTIWSHMNVSLNDSRNKMNVQNSIINNTVTF
jgi:hypothetical protein